MTTPANSLNITQPGFPLFDGSANFYAPNKILSLYDDFLVAANSTTGQLFWEIPFPNSIDGTSTNPGLMRIDNAASGGSISLNNTSGPSNFVLGGGVLYINFVFNIGALSTNTNAYTTYIGMTDTGISGLNVAPVNGCYFQYTHTVNSGKWQLVNNDGATSVVNSSVAAAIGFHNYGIIINADATSVSFTIDGIVVGTNAAHIPTQVLTPGLCSVVSAGSLPNQTVDLFYLTNVLTTAR